MINVYGILAILLLCVLLASIGAFVYVSVTKKKVSKGNLVRTTFTGNPAVLTSALWGLDREFANSVSFGSMIEFDGVNALHCDVPGAFGTYSSWLSNGGIDFKTNPNVQNAPLYWSQDPCVANADCKTTQITCGPGFLNKKWLPNTQNPAANQCPPNSFCDVCPSQPSSISSNKYCSDISDAAIGRCKVNPDVLKNYSPVCVYDSLSDRKVCAAVNAPTTGKPPFNRLGSCTTASDWQKLPQCMGTNSSSYFYCGFQGNVHCAKGETCSANWGSVTGWSNIPGTALESQGLTYSAYVCSGTSAPTVLLNTVWIAEGELISTNGTVASVEWKRVQNTYDGIGPVYDLLLTSASRFRDSDDLSWAYNDCRFIKMNSSVSSRHTSVTLALLGTSISNPIGLDALLNDPVASEILYIGDNVGTLAVFPNLQDQPYHRSAWNLRSQIPIKNLERIWFYSIQALNPTPDAVALFYSNSTR
jgi:hypothetical protein